MPDLYLMLYMCHLAFRGACFCCIHGFHCHNKGIKLQTIQYRKSRIWGIKEDKYTKGLAKNQVFAMFHLRDIRKTVLPKFIKLCMETP